MNWFRRFMTGRYGNDNLNNFLLILALICIVLSTFTRLLLLEAVGLACLCVCYFRMFSRNVGKRAQENQLFLECKGRVTRFFSREKNVMSQRKDYHIYTCSKCRQKIRIPRGKGRIEITCPRCGNRFVKKS